jgi:hypothetical protein
MSSPSPRLKQALNASLVAARPTTRCSTSYVTTVSRRMDQLCGPIVKRTVTETFDGLVRDRSC